jgi:hypothetical protein
MLLNTDWYIDQMKLKAYNSDPLPVTLPAKKYFDGVNNQVYVVDQAKGPVDIKTVIDWVMSDNPQTKIRISQTETLDAIPTKTIRIMVDSARAIASGAVKPEDADKIVPYIDIKLKSSAIMKSQLIVLDILAHNNWARPIYFVTGYHNDAMGLEEYFQLEGLAYRLVPIKSPNRNWLDYARIDTDILYENMMKKFAWKGAREEGVDVDYNHRRTLLVVKARYNYARLAKALVSEGKNEKAAEVLDYCMTQLPVKKLSYDMYMPDIIEAYFAAGAPDKAAALSKDMCDFYFARLDYYFRQDPYILSSAEYEVQSAMQYTSRVAEACKTGKQEELYKTLNGRIEEYYARYMKLFQPGAGQIR